MNQPTMYQRNGPCDCYMCEHFSKVESVGTIKLDYANGLELTTGSVEVGREYLLVPVIYKENSHGR